LIAEIARGGMGVVYLDRAEDEDGKTELFAVKTLLPEFAGEEQYRRMFLAEANLGVRLEHPNIVRTVEVGGSKKQYFMALEYLDGQSLRAVRRALRDLSLSEGLRILGDVLAALHYAHTVCDLDGTPLNVVHRDMSPENVFLTYDGRVVLLDFGVAKADDSGGKTEVGKLKGRIRYMAPEQVLGTAVDGRADVFAVGILLWEIITGRRFWHGVEEVTILRQLLSGEIPPLPPYLCSERLAAAVTKALALSPADRFPTAESFRLELEAAALELGERDDLADLNQKMATHFASARERVRALVDGTERTSNDDPLPSVALPVGDPSLSSRSGAHTKSLGSSPAGVVDATSPPSHTKPARGGFVLAAMAVVGVAVGAFAMKRAAGPADPGMQTATVSAANSAPQALSAASAATNPADGVKAATVVELVVDCTPSTAQVALDGVVMTGGAPYRRRVEADDKTHQLTFAAPGYEPHSEEIRLDANATLRVTLDPVSTTPGAKAKKKKAGAAGAATSETDPSHGSPIKGGVAPTRDINTKNPYGN
jgi:eukaryotic-like serine/threonine-protein kinase